MTPSPLSIRPTTDGSSTVFSETFGETYHSIHGAVAESMHVFIRAGLLHHSKRNLNIFEVGFGTGLNVLLTLLETELHDMRVKYISIEKYPVEEAIIQKLNFPDLTTSQRELFVKLHSCPWNQETPISPSFSLLKLQGDVTETPFPQNIDLVYFDAFSPESQPEMWTTQVFQKLYDVMNPCGIIVTYCAKGIVRRTMQDVGFIMERLQGPPPKREILRGMVPGSSGAY